MASGYPGEGGLGAATSPPWMVARLDVTSRGSGKRSHLGQAQADKAICAQHMCRMEKQEKERQDGL